MPNYKVFIAAVVIIVMIVLFYDGLFTPKVRIGKQVWMLENLDVVTFRNGDTIKEARSKGEWNEATKNKEPAWCYYKNRRRSSRTVTGKLYNWYAIADKRGLAPEGWRVPTGKDWNTLIKFLGDDKAAEKLRGREGWETYEQCNNESGFTAIPGGYRDASGFFSSVKELGYWWTIDNSMFSNNFEVEAIYMDYKSDVINFRVNKGAGLSIRCIKSE